MCECGICNQHRSLFCGGCVTQLVLRARINVLNATSQLDALQEQTSNVLCGVSTGKCGNKAQTTMLKSRSERLQRRIDLIRTQTQDLKAQTLLLLEKQAERQTKQQAHIKQQETFKQASTNQINAIETKRLNQESVLEQVYRDMLHLSLGLQSKCCQDLLDIFALRKKRKKVGYEIVLGHVIVPDLLQLANYPTTTINAGLERVANFVVLLASYLGIRLPYNILLPTKRQAYVRLGPQHLPLWLPHSVKTMMRSSALMFHQYCELAGMLALDVAHLALKLGLSTPQTLDELAKVNQLLAQCYLRVEGLIKSGSQIKVYSGELKHDLDSMQDHLITQLDIALNGQQAEWNIIDHN